VERFLSLCAQDNMTVALPSTPANYFHLLRWQGLSGRRKPLIVFTPKSLLRLKAAASAATDFTSGSFQPVIGDSSVDPARVRRVVLCSGKVYYDLAARQAKVHNDGVAVVRVERLYPLPVEELKAELSRYPSATEIVWAQEEPANMGAWPTFALKLPKVLGREVTHSSLPASSAPAPGSASKHAEMHQRVIEEAIPDVLH
jgi:2-oxoglutarate decarboxylase